MLKKMSLLLATTTLSMLPFVAHANIKISNNTNNTMTVYAAHLCSGIFGDKGKIPKRSSIDVEQELIGKACLGYEECNVDVHMTDYCSNTTMATVTINTHRGITAVTNFDKGHYDITWTANSLTVTQTARGLSTFLNSLFNL